MTPDDWGRIAYEGYRQQSRGKSLISGSPIPPYHELPTDIQAAWIASADATRRVCADLITNEASAES